MTQRYIPTGFIAYTPDLSSIGDYKKDLFSVYVYADLNRPQAVFYKGKRKDPLWFYRFRTIDEMKKHINDSISRILSWEDKKKERKQKKQEEALSVKVGDIFSYSWGYEQTNVDFYQVVKITGKTFTIREIKHKSYGEAPSGYMSDYVSPCPNEFVNDTLITKRNFSMPHGVLSPTSAEKKHLTTWYA